jgi:S1-C subfamily serine protease
VTALDQSITATDSGGGNAEQLSGLIQTNAGVQPGDSGGPLYDAAGAIVGMDTAASRGGAVQAYAIPISAAEGIATQIEQGVTSTTIQQGYPPFLTVSVGDGQGGVAVLGVTVTSTADLTAAPAAHAPGQQATVTWADAAGSLHSATVTLGSGPAQ